MTRTLTLTIVLLVTVLLPVAAIADDDRRPVELSVAFKVEPGQADAAGDIVASLGGRVEPLIASRGVFRGTTTVWAKARDADKTAEKSTKKLADAVRKDKRVQWAQGETNVRVDGTRFYAWPHGSPVTAGQQPVSAVAALDDLDLEAVHRISTGAGVVVAVLDTGVDATHPLLADRVTTGFDMVDDDAAPAEETNDLDDDHDGHPDEAYGHGTFIAGVVAQVAPSATILPVRVLDDDGQGSLHSVVEGIDYAIAAGADVINLSFGAVAKPEAKVLYEAMKRAHKADVAIVAAAGNDGGEDKRYPAAYGDVISVTSAASGGRTLPGFASRGDWIDVAAPGVAVASAFPGGGYATWDGSSVAAGVVSGQTALLRALDPGGDVKHAEKRLFKSARKLEHKLTHHGVTDVLASMDVQ